jgi:oligopeptidase B
MSMLGRLAMTAAAVALSTAVAVASSAAPAAAADGLRVESTTTYTIDASAGVVHVEALMNLTNTVPDHRDNDSVHRAYFTGFSLPAPVGAVGETAVDDAGRPLTISGHAVEGNSAFLLYDVAFAENLFYGKTTRVTVKYDITGLHPRSQNPSRINPAYAAFNAFGTGDAGKVTVRVVAPAGFRVDTFGNTADVTTEGDNTVYTASDIEDPDTFNIFVSARNDASLIDQSVINTSGNSFNVRSWPGDSDWPAFVTTQINDGIPVLAELIGRPWPIDHEVEIRQAYTPYLYGYAGWFSATNNEIEIGENLDQVVTLHELSHAWFSEKWFADRWLSEGYAQTYSNMAKGRLAGVAASPAAIDGNDAGKVQLNEWGKPRLAKGADSVERYGYNASWSVVADITNELGIDKMQQVFAAIAQSTIAYPGHGPAESLGTNTDWKRYLDLVDEIGGSTKADALIEQYVATPDQQAILATRTATRTRYHALVAAGGAWAPPLTLRKAMVAWSFDNADLLITAATDVLHNRDELAAFSADLGVTPPEQLQAGYEGDIADLTVPAQKVADQLDATKKVLHAAAVEAGGGGVFGGVGLIGTNVSSDLAAAKSALAEGRTGEARSIAAHVIDVVENAPDVGKLRSAFAAGALLALFGTAALIVLLIGRRRRRDTAPMFADVSSSGAGLTHLDEDALTGAGQSSVDHGLLVARVDFGQAPTTARIVEHEVCFGHVGDPVLQLHEHVGKVVDAQSVASAQVLIDPHPHDIADFTATTPPVGESAWTDTVIDVDEPVAKRIQHRWDRPTGAVDDPWAWLRDRDDPDTIAYLEAENAYAAAWFADRHDLVETIFGEIKSRIQETDLTAPVKDGGWWYTSRTEEGRNYPIHCRGRSAADAGSQILLDENREAEGDDFFSVDAFDVSPDQQLLAWSADVEGAEKYTLHIRDLRTGVDTADVVHDIAWSGTAWSHDNGSLFYVTANEAMRPYRVWRHDLGTVQADDTLIFEEADERFYVSVVLSRSAEWIIIDSRSKTFSEVMLIPAGDATRAPRIVRQRTEDIEYSVDHWGDRFVILTNLEAVDFRVMLAPIHRPGEWSELVAHQPGRRIVDVEPFEGHLVLHEWSDAQQRLRALFSDNSERVFDLGSEPHELEVDANPEWRSETFRYRYQSLTTPLTIFDEQVRSGRRTMLKQTPVPGVDLSRYTATREWAISHDGTRVPIDLVRHVDTKPNGTAPCLIYGYGSYEASMPPWFSPARLSLLDRGFVWALAHPRGGGEFGRRWYLDGKLLNKRNTFLDMIAGAEHVVANHWASPRRVAVRGASAGGLLVGACVTMRPELFAAAVAEVPFVDIVTTMHDETLPLTITEWDEWGNPASEPLASYMLSYSPYDQTKAADYPAMFITAGINDVRVSYHEPAKWIAKLRAVRTNAVPLIMKCEMGAGHAGPSGRYDLWREEARTLSFLVSVV